MGEKLTLKLDEREVSGKKVARLRREGIIPGVVYGTGTNPLNVQVAEGVFRKVYTQAGTHAPVHLTIGSKRKIAMIKDVDFTPTKGRVVHVAFHAVKATEPVNAEVPIRLLGEGESEAERSGLVVLQTLEKVEVKALPMDLPEALEVNIGGLKEPGEKLLLSDITLPENVELVEHKSGTADEDEDGHSVLELVVASVWEPSALQAANEAAAGEASAETEVAAEKGGEEAPAEAGATEEKAKE